jgi:hypothetical protein
MLGNIESDEKAISAQACLVDPTIPPIPHQLPQHELFDLVAKRDGHQIQAIVKGLLMNPPDGGGYHDAYERAFFECPLPNLLQPVAKNHGCQPDATPECPIFD